MNQAIQFLIRSLTEKTIIRTIMFSYLIVNILLLLERLLGAYAVPELVLQVHALLQIYKAKGEFTVDWPMFMTLTVITLVPIFIFFIVMQKYIVKGNCCRRGQRLSAWGDQLCMNDHTQLVRSARVRPNVYE